MKDLLPDKSVSVEKNQKILCVLKPTQVYPSYEKIVLGDRSAGGGHKENLYRKIITYPIRTVFYRMNPRSLDYMLSFALSFLRNRFEDVQIDLLVEPSGWKMVSEHHKKEIHCVFQSRYVNFSRFEDGLHEKISQQGYDAIALLYADSVGISWMKIEKFIRKIKGPSVFVINGRRRVFVWDTEARRNLCFRRILEKSWFFEIALFVGFILFTPFVVFYDLLERKLIKKFSCDGLKRIL